MLSQARAAAVIYAVAIWLIILALCLHMHLSVGAVMDFLLWRRN